MNSFAEAIADGPVVLDGGFATQLEARGHDLSSDLWSARLLAEDPQEIMGAHRDFFAAGAQVAITASYQVSFEAMATAGFDKTGTSRLLALSIKLARDAAQDTPTPSWVAASVGPYGASLAGGQEYVGDYGLSVAELRSWHHARLLTLIEAQPDVLALETIPCLAEVDALLTEVAGTGMPCWLSLTNQGLHTRQGEPLEQAFAMANEVAEVVAVGVNCCSTSGLEAVIEAAAQSTAKPVIVYPNSGEGWDGTSRDWTGEPVFDPTSAPSWVAAGAALVGGCCRVTPADIASIARQLGKTAT